MRRVALHAVSCLLFCGCPTPAQTGDGGPRSDSGSATEDAGCNAYVADAGICACFPSCAFSSQSARCEALSEFPFENCGSGSDLFAPICGCDGTTYQNAQFLASCGVDPLHDGPCDAGP